MIQDLQHGVRMLAKQPSFTLLAGQQAEPGKATPPLDKRVPCKPMAPSCHSSIASLHLTSRCRSVFEDYDATQFH